MLETNPGSIMLEAGLSSASTKRNPFELLSSIFGKKKTNEADNEAVDDREEDFHNDNPSDDGSTMSTTSARRCATAPLTVGANPTDDASPISCNFLPRSPASAKYRNLKDDLEALHLSRQDNPYLQQLERLSLQEESLLSCEFPSLSDKPIFQSEWHLGSEGEMDLHQHLVRSPPPQFPQNVSHFMYLSRANSPKHQTKDSSDSPDSQSPQKDAKKQKVLNPLQSKSGVDVLDPGVREVLEFQKQQLVTDSRCSMTSGPIDFSRSSHSDIPATPSRLLPIATRPQARWSNTTGSRPYHGGPSPVSNVTGSLPGLTSCYLGLFNAGDLEARTTPLRPVKVGRTQSDGVMMSSSVQDLLTPSPNNFVTKNGGQSFGYLFSTYVSKTGSQEPLLNTSKASSLDVG